MDKKVIGKMGLKGVPGFNFGSLDDLNGGGSGGPRGRPNGRPNNKKRDVLSPEAARDKVELRSPVVVEVAVEEAVAAEVVVAVVAKEDYIMAQT
ncbi:P-loop containing nucleoside triphosphate hydrolase protein [Penicillium verhagenii]|nr:P-loop containing nucleoside triphosphate hydrolase protein [Penicillium verhagenii]